MVLGECAPILLSACALGMWLCSARLQDTNNDNEDDIVNKVYALVWNQALGCWNVTHEGARRRCKSSGKGVVMAAVAMLGLGALAPAFALPVGGKVVEGAGDIFSYGNGSQMFISQYSDKMITNWTDFSIDAGQRVTFNQPTASSVALNRVIGTNVSSIKGQMDANGRVFLVNPNGIFVGQGAQVNVGSLVATTKAISDADFLAGKYHFTGTSIAKITNNGTLTAAPGGNIALLGSQVRNDGVIQAQMGRVALGAGTDFTVNFDGNNLLNLQVDAAAVNALAHNGGLLKADGGQVLMTARSAGNMLQTVVNNQGAIEAKTLSGSAGKITLDGGDVGTVRVGGVLTANALNGSGNGGVVEVKGAKVNTQLGTQVSTLATNGQTGTWKISSGEVNVSQTAATVGGTTFSDTLSRNLADTNIELTSTLGDLSLSEPVSWNSSNGLTLNSAGNVNLNGALKATGTGARVAINAQQDANLNSEVSLTGLNNGMSLNYGGRSNMGKDGLVTLSEVGASYQSNGVQYGVIQDVTQLQDVNDDLDGHYVLGNDISSWNYFDSIGANTAFRGVFDGQGNTIRDLSVHSTGSNLGLFAASSGSISNLKLMSMRILHTDVNGSSSSIGGLVGLNTGRVSNVSSQNVDVAASNEGNNTVGGLVGRNLGGTIDNSSSHGRVTGNAYTNSIGGLVGENITNGAAVASITNSVSQANVNSKIPLNYSGGVGGVGGVGGLVGANNAGYIADSSSSGSTNGMGKGLSVGGLVGYNENGVLERTSASGEVFGDSGGSVGGLVGLNVNSSVTGATSSGTVVGKGSVGAGGLVGTNQNSNLVDVKAIGNVTDYPGENVGGLVGNNVNGRIDTAQAQGIVIAGDHSRVGGLVGYNHEGAISYSVARGNTTAGSESYVGGLVGFNEGTLQEVEASGDVVVGNRGYGGGLVGYNGSEIIRTIESASASGNVQGGTSSVVGGLVGQSAGRISNATSTGSVASGFYGRLGGLVGLNVGEVRQSVTTGKVDLLGPTYDQDYGGLVGVNYGDMFYNRVYGEAEFIPLAGINTGTIR